jgi:ribonuclease VapC
MIVVDTSAILAILLNEPDAGFFHLVLSQASDARISALTDYETRIVVFHRRGERLLKEYAIFLAEAELSAVAFDERQSSLAFDAYRRWGKGNHPAGLNLGDCAAYALAKSLEAPLLFKGADFTKTDVRPAA